MPAKDATGKQNHLMGFIVGLGDRALRTVEHIGSLTYLFADTIRWVARGIGPGRARVGKIAIIAQICRVGVASIFIVSLVSGAIGFILALQMAPPLDKLGQVELVPNIVAVAVARELGPLVAAIVLIGFAGAAIAAELGTMAVATRSSRRCAGARDQSRSVSSWCHACWRPRS